MGVLSQVLEEYGFSMTETILYYENRPHPFSELWVNESRKTALIIDHDICEQPVCGATWSYRGYVNKQNQISETYRWLRYDVKALDALTEDLQALEVVTTFRRIERRVDPRKNHPQIIGSVLYQKKLAEWRKEMLQGNSMKVLVSL